MSTFINSIIPETVISEGMRMNEVRTKRVNAAAFKRAQGSVTTSKVLEATKQHGVMRVTGHAMPMPYIDDRHLICSIYPLPLFRERPQGDVRNGGMGVSRYYIPGVKRGEYAMIECAPGVTWLTDWSGGIDNAPGGKSPVLTTGFEVARSLVDYWRSGSVIPVGSIGVDLVPDGVEEGTDEFLDFIAQLTARQEAQFQYVVDQSEANYKTGKPIENLDRAMTAAAWLYGDNATRFEWFGRQRFVNNKACPACQAEMKQAAIVCGQCRTNLLDFFNTMGISAKGNDETVYLYQVCLQAYKKIPTPAMIERVLTGENTEDVALAFEQNAPKRAETEHANVGGGQRVVRK